jgi:8-oxo-dGTP pyrophosphatase MutT (NUDIX family)
MEPRILERRVVFESRKFLVVETDLQFPDGHREVWEHVELKGHGGVRVCPVTAEDEVVFVREYRGAAGRFVLKLPTGSIEEGEDAATGARRELEEETGLRAARVIPVPLPSQTSTYVKFPETPLFLALDLGPGVRKLDPGEHGLEVVKIPLARLDAMLRSLELDDPSTVFSLLAARKALEAL